MDGPTHFRTVQLVTPVFVSTNIGVSAIVPVFARLTLHFVTEPATCALLGGGVVVLAIGGARRARRAA